MKHIVLFLIIVAFGVFASSLPRPASAIPNWPPLLSCPDITATGAVGGADIATVVLAFGTTYAGTPDQYLLLNDVDGGGAVGGSDIATVVLAFGQVCPKIDTQVAQATLAMTGKYGGPDLRDPAQATQDAFACDPGTCPLYVKSSQDVPSMGIHLFSPILMAAWEDCCGLGKPGETGESQLIHPVGLVYTDAGGGSLGRLIGAWYIQPTPDVCAEYGIPLPCQDESVQPVGFGDTNDDEDNQALGPNQDGWHTHAGLCIWNWGENNATVAEGVNVATCEGSNGIFFSTYGWMLHLYNFLPNPDGRFMKWNANVP